MNTHTIVVDMHQNMLKVRGDAESQNRVVSDTHALQHHRTNTDHYLGSKQVSDSTSKGLSALFLYPVHLGNHHLHHRGTTLDATS